MAQRMTAFRWLGWEMYELPPEVATAVTEEEHLLYAKAIVVCAAGDAEIAQPEREWIVGLLTTAGVSPEITDAIETYDGSDTIEDLLSATPAMPVYGRSMIYDALRACSSDGELSAGERDRVFAAADRMNLSRQVVEELEQVVREEGTLRKRRHKLIVADAFAEAPA
ncbi:MAG TPA: hypothetical protein VM942_09540 [Acidimicrobiales bacterium]|nr:hypothetical protein [Acidimicrobiales bacterium]